MGAVLQLWDRLTNVLSGMGTSQDKRTHGYYVFMPTDPQQAEAGYRTSWLVRKIVDIPPFDMTRARRDWQADSKDIEAIEAEERRLQLWPKLLRALILGRLFGGGALILGTNERSLEEPINAERIAREGLRYIHVMSRHQLSEGAPRLDPEDEWFGFPDFFSINTGVGPTLKLHPSRVVAFVGQKAPEGTLLTNGSWFWGDPIMQSVGEAVKNADLAQSGFAALIDEAQLDIIKMPDLTTITATSEGTQQLMNRLAATKAGKSTWRMVALDEKDEWQQRQVTWAGIPDTMMAFLQVVAGAADIPITRLLGQSPKGLQSSGDGEERDYHSMVRARQDEILTPALDRIDPLLVRSALGKYPSDIYFEYAGLENISEKDAAEIENKNALTLKSYADTGLLPDAALAKIAANKMIESGRFPGSEKAFEEHKAELEDPDKGDEQMLQTREAQVQAMQKKGAVTPEQAKKMVTDAAPRSLYVQRKLLNGREFIGWAKSQGFATTVPEDELHVTICFSRSPVDWVKMGSPWDEDEQGRLRVRPGGARIVEKLGDKGAVVLLFTSSQLSWRHEEMVRNGASHDYDEYQPHVTITYAGSDIDLSKVEPYRGELVFGPEIFEEVKEDWEKDLVEDGGSRTGPVPFEDSKRGRRRIYAFRSGFDPNQPRDLNGQWVDTGARAFIANSALARGESQSHAVGEVSALAARKAAANGIEIKGKPVALDSDMVVHILRRHGPLSRDKTFVAGHEIASAHIILGRAKTLVSAKQADSGAKRFEVTARLKGNAYVALFEVRRKAVVLVTLRRER